MKIKKITQILLGTVLLFGAIAQAQAEDKKVDPSGTYIWTMPGRNGGPAWPIGPVWTSLKDGS